MSCAPAAPMPGQTSLTAFGPLGRLTGCVETNRWYRCFGGVVRPGAAPLGFNKRGGTVRACTLTALAAGVSDPRQ